MQKLTRLISSSLLASRPQGVWCQSSITRSLATETQAPTEGEKRLADVLKKQFPLAKAIEVNDISGGCGSMYAIFVESIEFKNMRKVKQHQLVNDTLKAQIKEMHGVRIQTSVPER